jgi:hypothetical protein
VPRRPLTRWAKARSGPVVRMACQAALDRHVAGLARALPADPPVASWLVTGLADAWGLARDTVTDQIPRGREATDLVDGGHQRESRDRADPWQGEQPAASAVSPALGWRSAGPRWRARRPGSRSGAGSCRPSPVQQPAAPELPRRSAMPAHECRTGRARVGGRPRLRISTAWIWYFSLMRCRTSWLRRATGRRWSGVLAVPFHTPGRNPAASSCGQRFGVGLVGLLASLADPTRRLGVGQRHPSDPTAQDRGDR